MIYFAGDLFIRNKNVKIESSLLQKLDKKDNVLIFNLESVILDKSFTNSRSDKSAILHTEKEAFKSFISLFKSATLYFNLGNNHLHDFGTIGIETTINFLTELNVNYFGFINQKEDYSSLDLIIENKKIKIVSITTEQLEVMSVTSKSEDYYTKEINLINEQEITNHKTNCDCLIYLPHWGKEYIPYPTLQNLQLASKWRELGVNYIIGSHPHIIQGFQNNTYFSLGNFFFSNFKKKNKIWHIWKPINRKSLIIGVNFFNERNEVIGVDYKKDQVFESIESISFFNNVTNRLELYSADSKKYFGLFEFEYYKYLKSTYKKSTQIKGISMYIFGRIYEKVFNRSFFS